MTTNINKFDAPTLKQKQDSSAYHKFQTRIRNLNAIACTDKRGVKLNVDQAIAESNENMNALNAEGGLQEMLIAQMASIHHLQQMTASLALTSGFLDTKQFYTNSVVKLSNCFTELQSNVVYATNSLGGNSFIH